mmetsp:Transcript_14844/g.56171  ORF Transcript_14844/g.56171 Transcript_14844/m.56171 type:complete len:374 (+) Transcript_14844:17015-18136(+)
MRSASHRVPASAEQGVHGRYLHLSEPRAKQRGDPPRAIASDDGLGPGRVGQDVRQAETRELGHLQSIRALVPFENDVEDGRRGAAASASTRGGSRQDAIEEALLLPAQEVPEAWVLRREEQRDAVELIARVASEVPAHVRRFLGREDGEAGPRSAGFHVPAERGVLVSSRVLVENHGLLAVARQPSAHAEAVRDRLSGDAHLIVEPEGHQVAVLQPVVRLVDREPVMRILRVSLTRKGPRDPACARKRHRVLRAGVLRIAAMHPGRVHAEGGGALPLLAVHRQVEERGHEELANPGLQLSLFLHLLVLGKRVLDVEARNLLGSKIGHAESGSPAPVRVRRIRDELQVELVHAEHPQRLRDRWEVLGRSVAAAG